MQVEELDIDADLAARTIVVPKHEYSRVDGMVVNRPFTIVVPERFGVIDRVEQRGEYLAVFTHRGKLAYYLTRGHNNVGLPSRIGMMTWHNLRKAIREHCIAERFVGRVDFFITYYRNSGGNSRDWAHGRVTVDGEVVYAGNDIAWELGHALEEYLHLSVREALGHEDVVIRSLALLDRRSPDGVLDGCELDACDHPMWTRFLDLRRGTVP